MITASKPDEISTQTNAQTQIQSQTDTDTLTLHRFMLYASLKYTRFNEFSINFDWHFSLYIEHTAPHEA